MRWTSFCRAQSPYLQGKVKQQSCWFLVGNDSSRYFLVDNDDSSECGPFVGQHSVIQEFKTFSEGYPSRVLSKTMVRKSFALNFSNGQLGHVNHRAIKRVIVDEVNWSFASEVQACLRD